MATTFTITIDNDDDAKDFLRACPDPQSLFCHAIFEKVTARRKEDAQNQVPQVVEPDREAISVVAESTDKSIQTDFVDPMMAKLSDSVQSDAVQEEVV